MDWWNLPGPQCFIQNIVQDMRDGRNVIICLPEHSPERLALAVRESLDEEGGWERIDYQNSLESLPVDFLYQYYVNDCQAEENRTIPNLFSHDGIRGKIIWLDGISAVSWTLWREFIIRYESVCRGMSILGRTVFCIPLKGISTIQMPGEEVCLSVRKYTGISDSIDMLIYASHLTRTFGFSGVKAKLVPVIISKISLWDAHLAESLSRQSFETLLSPSEFLKKTAIERGWLNEEGEIIAPLWELGMKDIFEGEECLHSSILINETETSELQRRLWSAEVSVLYPYIEEQRQIILNHLKRFLSVPYTTRFGEVITDIKDLEIGHIEAVLSNNSSFRDREMRKRISDLRKMRNDLAHLIPIESTQFLSEAIKKPLKINVK
ncbi:MAG: hypothetical protein BWK80_59740 [Desulfobacteraceae bacterium IS3]|nr:MAG: hypothetical protein BWK80_59740 [Desulfobacteraceae bacterium IS3]